MNPRRACLLPVLLALPAALLGCERGAGGGADAEVATRGSVEVTARLLEVPDGALVRRDLYTYATVLKYEVLTVHRGAVDTKTIHVAHYNPHKPRRTAGDSAVSVGGTLASFLPGQAHRMALAAPLDDHYMGPLINRYAGQDATIYLALWTNLAR